MTGSQFSLSGKRVWVAGHTGMVGSAIVRRLASRLVIPKVITLWCSVILTMKIVKSHNAHALCPTDRFVKT